MVYARAASNFVGIHALSVGCFNSSDDENV